MFVGLGKVFAQIRGFGFDDYPVIEFIITISS